MSWLRAVVTGFLTRELFELSGSVRHAEDRQHRWWLWTIASYALLSCTMLLSPATTLAQACATPPASWLWYFGSGANVYGPTASAACAAGVGVTYVAGLPQTIVAAPVGEGSQEIPGPGAFASCVMYLTWPGMNEPFRSPSRLDPQHGPCPNFWLETTQPPRAQVHCPNCVKDPINPGLGNVFDSEDDVHAGGIAFRRFYNSEDAAGGSGGSGWRHSYGRSVSTVYQAQSHSYPGQSALITAQYSHSTHSILSARGATIQSRRIRRRTG
jgi:hypothetical protein